MSDRRARRAATTILAVTLQGVVLLGGAVPLAAAPVASAPVAAAATADGPPRIVRSPRTAEPLAAGALPASVTRTNRVLVRWTTSATRGASAGDRLRAIATASGTGAAFVRTSGAGSTVYELGAPLGGRAARILATLRRVAGVASVEPDLWVTAADLPDDPYAAQLWGLLGAADGSPYGIDARTAWPTTTGGGVVVAVIDTGLVAHTDLAGQSVAGYDMISAPATANDGDGRDSNASDPGDACNGHPSSWHGTHVAGTIAALANNALGVFGGAPGVKIQPVRVLGTCGGYSSDVADGIRWAAGGTVPGVPANTTPARVLNLSLGGSSFTCGSDYAAAIADARSRGAVVVVAAGNAGIDAGGSSPANCPAALTVAAIDQSGRRASFSNYGPLVDIAAPGVGIISTIDAGTTSPVGPTYASYNGTSMATPHVALSAALVAAAYPALTPDAIEAVLEATATPFAIDGSDAGCAALGCGSGDVNVGRAITALAGVTPIVGMVVPADRYPAPSAPVAVTAAAVDRTGVASAQVSVDDGPWAAMSAVDGAFGAVSEAVAATIVAPPGEGDHTVCVRATDPAAHTSDGTACATITVDAGPPVVGALDVSPATSGQGEVVTLTATATDGVAVRAAELSIDGGAWLTMAASDGAFDEAVEGLTGKTAGAVAAVDAGYLVSCALLADASVRCWGWNAYGQLGDGTTKDRQTPVAVTGLSNVVQIAAGEFHACALLVDTTVRCWGYNANGQLGDGTTTDSAVPIVVSGLTGVARLSIESGSTCALMANATVRCWGFNGNGQLGDGTRTERHGPVSVPGLSNVTGLASANGHRCALLADTTVRCWGFNPYGAVGDGSTTDRWSPVAVTGLTNVTAIVAGYYHACALLANGSVQCWGGNNFGELGDGSTIERHTPVAVPGLAAVTAIAIGGQNSCALVADASVRCWGENSRGQVGDGTTVDRHSPVAVAGLAGVAALSVGGADPCVVLADATLRCWGDNSFGELGDGTLVDHHLPTRVAGIGALTAGPHSVCARATDSAGHRSDGTSCTTMTATDTTAPRVLALVSTTASPTAGATIGYSLTFSEAVGGLTAGDLSIGGTSNGWSVTGITGSGAGPYAITVGAATSNAGTVSLTLAASGVTDSASNPGPTSPVTAADVTVTRSVPGQPTSVAAAPSQSSVVVSWHAPATTGGTAITGYAATVTPGAGTCATTGALTCTIGGLADGSYTLTVTATNGVGVGAPSSAVPFTIDTTVPAASLTGPATPTKATTLVYTLTFSEPVTGLAAGDFTRTGTAAGCLVGAPTGSGAAWTVAVSGCGQGSVVLALKPSAVVDLAANPGPAVAATAATVMIDRTAPTVTVPVAAPHLGGALAGTWIPVTVTWTGADGGGAGIARHEIARSTNGGATWTTLSTTLTSGTLTATVPSSGTVRFRVRAIDLAGNVGAWVAGPTLARSFLQQNASAVKYAGAWTTATGTAWSGGSARYARAAGASATYTFTGRSIALLTTLAPTRGKLRIYVNGTLVATLDCWSPATTYRVLAWQRTYSTTVTRTVKFVVVGTAGRPRVDIDALAVLR